MQSDSKKESDKTTCLICNKELCDAERCTVKKKGINGLIASSKKRNDKKHLKFDKYDVIYLHIVCRTVYNRTSSITTANVKKHVNIIKKGKDEFDFESLCLFCGEDASKNFIENEIKRKGRNPSRKVHFVNSENVKINILTYLARQKKDNIDYDEALEARVQNVDLVNSKARYHQSCLKNFYYPIKSNIVGRPLSESSNDVIENLS